MLADSSGEAEIDPSDPNPVVRWGVFCGSSLGHDPIYFQMARETGAMLARCGIEVVYGGGNVGLMGTVADAAIAAGGKVTGVIPRSLAAREVAHAGITRLYVVDSMHERKALMNDLSSGFVMLPGGFGTFEEFCEVVTWVQLRIIDKPCVVLNAAGYYDPLIAMFDRAHTSGFINDRNRSIVEVVETVEALAELIVALATPRSRRLS
jgi:uncharacterized protein (TIGR00730 family)